MFALMLYAVLCCCRQVEGLLKEFQLFSEKLRFLCAIMLPRFCSARHIGRIIILQGR